MSYVYRLARASVTSYFADNRFDTPTASSGGILASSRTACRGGSYIRSTSVLRLGMPCRDQYSDPFVSNIFGRIVISVMIDPTSRTSPITPRERKLLIAMAAVRTQLRRWKPAADEDEVSVAPSRFVFDLPERLTMRRVLNRFGKLGSRHASQIQCFAGYRALL